MKRLLIVLMCILFLTGCQAKEEKNKIVMLVSSMDNAFFEDLSEFTRLKIENLGYDLVILDSANDVDIELENFLKHEDMKALILNPVDGLKSSHLVLEANDLSIPVITLDRNVFEGKVQCHIGSDNYEGGRLAASILYHNYRPGDEIVLLQGIVGTTANDLRVSGFKDALDYYGLEVTTELIAHFNRQEAIEVLQDQLDGNEMIFAVNDEMALGAVDVMIDAGFYVPILGFDGNKEALDAVSSGYMIGTIAQQPGLMADACVEVIEDILQGEEVSLLIKVSLRTVSIKEN